MKRFLLVLIAVVFLGSVSQNVAAQEMDVAAIVQKANLVSYYAGDDGRADVAMTITDAQGRTRKREFRILRMDVQDGGEQKFYVYFKKPTDVSKMVYMVWKQIGRDDDRWLYLPALDLVRRIAASDKRTSFVGSHFVYEDVSGRSIDADTHELIETTDAQHIIKNVPKEDQGEEFAYYTVAIDKNNFMPVKAEYFDEKGALIRTIEALEVVDVSGHPTVVKSKATDRIRNGSTIMEFSNVEYNIGLDDDVFTERYLRRPAMRWIR